VNAERRQQIEQLYRQAMAEPADRRDAFLERACRDDAELRREVESLFEHSGDPTVSLAYDAEWDQPGGGAILPLGTRLGPYEIVGNLGRGGMARVYRAKDTRLDRHVAIKVSAGRFGGHFEREARAISALNHPHICTLYDIGPNYLVMELVEGETLAARLRKGPLPVDSVLHYGAQICSALATAHTRGVVHRDLKPANIMITEAGVKVLDFGVAQSGARPGRSRESTLSDGEIVGTLAYMSPEQAEGRECDARTDIFALGMVLYEMATGKKISPASGAPEVARSLRAEPSPLDEVSPQLARVVRRCVAKEPERRWQTAPEVKAELESSPVRPDSRAWQLTTAGFAALALVAAIATIGILRRGPDEAPRMIPFTTYAGGQYEPAFSPDGSRIAFIRNDESAEVFNLYTKPVAGGDPLRLTAGPASEGSPAWSPDGSRIAFLRYAAPPGEAGIYIVPASGGAPSRLATTFPLAHIFDRHLDWSRDGRYVAVADNESDGKPSKIFLISPETGARRKLTDPPEGYIGDTGPAFAPDAKTLLFRRTVSAGVADLFEVPIAGGEPRRLTYDNQEVGGHAWTADGREIVFSSNRASNPGLWRIPVRGGEPRAIPSLRTWADFLAISPIGGRLAFSHWFVDTNIWRFRPGPGGVAAEATKLVASTRDDRSPQFSPDGAKIAFRSDRSGSNEIWIADSNGAHAVELTRFRGPLTGSPNWSPDGRTIAFDSRPMGNGDIFVVAATGGEARRITFDRANDVTPSWSSDGRWIYFASNRTGAYQVWKIAADSDEAKSVPVQVTQEGGFLAMEGPDRSLYYAKGPQAPGIWRLVQGGQELPVLPDYPAGYWGYWCVQDGGIYFVTPSTPDGGVLQFFNLGTQQVRKVIEFERRPLFSDSGLSVARGGTAVLYTQADTSGSEIMMVEGFR
jgi:Tol biopolymer transport system component